MMVQPSANCVSPNDIAAGDLIAYAEGGAEPAVTQHLERCDSCRDQAELYARTSNLLLSTFFRQACPPSLTIGEYAAGMLAGEPMREIAVHLVDCPHCRRESREFSAFIATPDEPLAERGPIAALRRIFVQPLRPLSPTLAGLRGGASESVTYYAEGLHLTVSVQRSGPGGHGGVIVGLLQEADESLTGSRVELISGEELLQTEQVDDLGNFLFSNVSAGRYRVEVTVAGAVVVIDPLDVS